MSQGALWALVMGVAMGPVGLAVAQEAPPAEPAQGEDRGLLAGPKVEEGEASPRGPGFMGEERGRRDDRPAVPPRRWMALYQEIAFTPEQRLQVTRLMAEFQVETKKFVKAHGMEHRDMSQRAMKSRGGDASAAPLSEAEQARLAELEALRPKIEDYQQRYWDILTPQQQDEFQQRLDQSRDDIAAQQRRVHRARERAAAGGAKAVEPAELDELAQRRLEFLRSRQKK